MKRFLASCAAVAALLGASPVLAAGVPTWITPSTAESGGSNTALTSIANGNCSIGSQALAIGTTSANSTDTFVDSGGNTWVHDKTWSLNGLRQEAWRSTLTSAIVSGTSTFTLGSNILARLSMAVFCDNAVPNLDVIGTGVGNVSGTSSSTTHTPGSANSTLVLAFLWKPSSTGTFTEDTAHGWTNIASIPNAGNNLLSVAYQVVASTATLTYAPSWSVAATSVSATISYTAPSATNHNSLLLTGVGQ